VEPTLGGKRISDIRRGQVQAIVDELAPKISGSRVRATSTHSDLSTAGRRTVTSSLTTRLRS
jgi:hypothetical protein